ncbi:hypothetical protein PZA11_006526 [Diplocarpon coronariae]
MNTRGIRTPLLPGVPDGAGDVGNHPPRCARVRVVRERTALCEPEAVRRVSEIVVAEGQGQAVKTRMGRSTYFRHEASNCGVSTAPSALQTHLPFARRQLNTLHVRRLLGPGRGSLCKCSLLLTSRIPRRAPLSRTIGHTTAATMNSSIFMKGSFATRARVKLWAHAAALTLSVIVTAIAAARMLISNSQRKNTPTTGGKRSSSGQVALSMGAKSIFFILYQILNEHTSMFKERPKANMILAIIDGISWPAVVAFTVQGVMKKCDGTTCTLSWIIIPLGVINSIISQVGAAVTFGDYKWFKQTGVLPSQLRDDRDLKMGPPAEAPRPRAHSHRSHRSHPSQGRSTRAHSQTSDARPQRVRSQRR